MRLVLASSSPRRRELLTSAGFEFDVMAAEIDERVRPGEVAELYVQRMAVEKAEAVHARTAVQCWRRIRSWSSMTRCWANRLMMRRPCTCSRDCPGASTKC